MEGICTLDLDSTNKTSIHPLDNHDDEYFRGNPYGSSDAHVQSPSEGHVCLHGSHICPHLRASGWRRDNHLYNERPIRMLCRHILLEVCDRPYHQPHLLWGNHGQGGRAGAQVKIMPTKEEQSGTYCITDLANVTFWWFGPLWTFVDEMLIRCCQNTR